MRAYADITIRYTPNDEMIEPVTIRTTWASTALRLLGTFEVPESPEFIANALRECMEEAIEDFLKTVVHHDWQVRE
jgi:hypothetical protein